MGAAGDGSTVHTTLLWGRLVFDSGGVTINVVFIWITFVVYKIHILDFSERFLARPTAYFLLFYLILNYLFNIFT